MQAALSNHRKKLTMSLEISTDAAVMAVLSKEDGIFRIIRTIKMALMAGKDILLLSSQLALKK